MPITMEAITTTTSITMNQSIRWTSGGSSTTPSGRQPHSGQTPSVNRGENYPDAVARPQDTILEAAHAAAFRHRYRLATVPITSDCHRR